MPGGVIRGDTTISSITVGHIREKLGDLFNSVESNGNYIRKTLDTIDDQASMVKVEAQATRANLECIYACVDAVNDKVSDVGRCLDARTFISNKQIYKLMKNWGKVKNESN